MQQAGTGLSSTRVRLLVRRKASTALSHGLLGGRQGPHLAVAQQWSRAGACWAGLLALHLRSLHHSAVPAPLRSGPACSSSAALQPPLVSAMQSLRAKLTHCKPRKVTSLSAYLWARAATVSKNSRDTARTSASPPTVCAEMQLTSGLEQSKLFIKRMQVLFHNAHRCCGCLARLVQHMSSQEPAMRHMGTISSSAGGSTALRSTRNLKCKAHSELTRHSLGTLQLGRPLGLHGLAARMSKTTSKH